MNDKSLVFLVVAFFFLFALGCNTVIYSLIGFAFLTILGLLFPLPPIFWYHYLLIGMLLSFFRPVVRIRPS